jgi:hypothetical protein
MMSHFGANGLAIVRIPEPRNFIVASAQNQPPIAWDEAHGANGIAMRSGPCQSVGSGVPESHLAVRETGNDAITLRTE